MRGFFVFISPEWVEENIPFVVVGIDFGTDIFFVLRVSLVTWVGWDAASRMNLPSSTVVSCDMWSCCGWVCSEISGRTTLAALVVCSGPNGALRGFGVCN